MLHRFILHNDRIQEASAETLAAGQVGLLAGWGVFSTLRVADGVLFAFERHWARIQRDAALFHVPLLEGAEALRGRLLDLVEANHAYDSTLRVAIVRNGGGMWAGPFDRPLERPDRAHRRYQGLGPWRQAGRPDRRRATPPASLPAPRSSPGR